MRFKQALKKLYDSKVYKEWKTKSCYLTYGFIMISEEVKQEWQIGCYDPKADRITAFTISDKVIKNPESEVFKKNSEVFELEPSKIKLTLEKTLEKAEEVQKTKYAQHTPVKKVVILQKLSIGQVWNITYITNTFKTLNIKIDAESGEVLKHDLIELFRFDK